MDTWKSNQANHSVAFLAQHFVDILAPRDFTAELVDNINQRFGSENKGNSFKQQCNVHIVLFAILYRAKTAPLKYYIYIEYLFSLFRRKGGDP